MKAVVVAYPFGMLAYSTKNIVVAKILFPKKPRKVAETMLQIQAGRAVDEIVRLVGDLKKRGYNTFALANALLADNIHERFDVAVEISRISETDQMLRSKMEKLAVELGFVGSSAQFNQWMHELNLEVAKLKVKRAVEKKDLLVINTIQTIDDLDKTVNLFMSRLREWYGIHFPELDRLIARNETYASLALEFGSRSSFTAAQLEKKGISKSKAKQIMAAAENSMGADLIEEDLGQIQTLGRNILNLNRLRQTFEMYLSQIMGEVAPNIKTLVNSLLGARLIALAGGLMNLAKMPSSTVQVLGAEKALFRSLKTGTRPPKHGVIFQQTFLHDAKKWQRGKIARALAGKLSIAARADAFGVRYIGEKLKSDLEIRLEEIRKKYYQPPHAGTRKQFKSRRRRKKKYESES